jgi:hypothetical protein
VACDLFNQVDFSEHVDAKRWRRDVPPGNGLPYLETQALEDAFDVSIRDVEPEHLLDARLAQFDLSECRRHRVFVDRAAACSPGTDLLKQRDRSLEPFDRGVYVGAAFESR